MGTPNLIVFVLGKPPMGSSHLVAPAFPASAGSSRTALREVAGVSSAWKLDRSIRIASDEVRNVPARAVHAIRRDVAILMERRKAAALGCETPRVRLRA
jgi:hypothetical protein